MDIALRNKREELFHNDLIIPEKEINVAPEKYFTAITAPENKYILAEIGSLEGKHILDLGCGSGEASLYFKSIGAKVTGLDASGSMINHAARKDGDIYFTHGFAEDMPFPDNSFDIVYCNGVLHHVEINQALKEIKRVLRSGGKAAFIEPLKHNFFINIYRIIANKIRSIDEKPLGMEDVESITKYFTAGKHKEFWLLTQCVFIKFFLSGVSPNMERYWKKIIYDEKKIEGIYRLADKVDQVLLKIKLFRKYCWNTVIIVEMGDKVHE